MRKTMIRSLTTLRKKALDKYINKVKTKYKKENPDCDEKHLDHKKYTYLEESVQDDMWEELISDYINDVLLIDKKVIDVKMSYSESGFIIGSSELYITIIYEEKAHKK